MPYANNKGADQPAQPHSLISAFVIRCLDSIIPLVFISKISSLYLASVAAQASLSLLWSQTPKTGILVMRLKCIFKLFKKYIQLQFFICFLFVTCKLKHISGFVKKLFHTQCQNLSVRIPAPCLIKFYSNAARMYVHTCLKYDIVVPQSCNGVCTYPPHI